MSPKSNWNKPAESSAQPEADSEQPVNEATGKWWTSHVFFGLSAVVHIAAAIALTTTWNMDTEENMPVETEAVQAPPPPMIARLPIDTAPIKYCELDIEKIVRPTQKLSMEKSPASRRR